jgi:hypothetical protein
MSAEGRQAPDKKTRGAVTTRWAEIAYLDDN